MRAALITLALIVAVPASADPTYEVVRRDWFNLTIDEQLSQTTLAEISGGPESVGTNMWYNWALLADAGQLSVWVNQHSYNNSSLHTHRAGSAKMVFDDVVFSDGTGTGATIPVRINLALVAEVTAEGDGVAAALTVTGTGGPWGTWRAEANDSAPLSTGVFAGLDSVNALSGVIQSNTFMVTADQPVTIEVCVEFVGTARWKNGSHTITTTEAGATLNPSEVFELPAGYTANSAQANVVDNMWSPGSANTPLTLHDGASLAFTSYPNPFRSQTLISFDLASQEQVDVAVYDVRGRRVRELLRGTASSGRNQLYWDGTTDDGRTLPPGAYFARIVAGAQTQSRVISLVR